MEQKVVQIILFMLETIKDLYIFQNVDATHIYSMFFKYKFDYCIASETDNMI